MRLVLAVVSLALLAAPGARAATVGVEAGSVQVSGGAAAEAVDVHRGGADRIVVDALDDATQLDPLGPECVQSFNTEGTDSVVCDVTNLGARVRALLAGGDDEAQVSAPNGPLDFADLRGGDGNDRLTGGPGPERLDGDLGEDTLVGGEGADALEGGEGSDELTGGPGADVLFDNGESGEDTVDYTDKTIVSVTMDSQPDDGNATDGPDGARDSVGQGFERVLGTDGPDFLEGAAGMQVLVGNGGNDRLDGSFGPDRLLGGAGDDALAADDGFADLEVDCGAGTDTATGDAQDPQPVGCETATGFPAPAPADPGPGTQTTGTTSPTTGTTTTTTTTAGPGTTTTAATTPGVPVTPAPPGKEACAGPPLNRCYPVSETLTALRMPNLVGLTDSQALDLLARLKLELAGRAKLGYDRRSRSRLPSHPASRRWAENMVTRQSIAPGTVLVTGAGGRLTLDLQLWDGKDRETCAESADELKGLDLDTVRTALAARGCGVDDVKLVVKDSTTSPGEADANSGDRCELVRAAKSSGRVNDLDLTIAAPDSPALTDLRVSVKEFPGRPSFIASEDRRELWTLPKGASTFVVVVQDREGALVNGVEVFVDASQVTGTRRALIKTRTGANAASGRQDQGSVAIPLTSSRTGKVRVVAFGAPRNGSSVCGAAEVVVSDPGSSFATISGNQFRKTRAGGWEQDAAALRAASLGDVFNGIGSLFVRLWGTVSRAVSGDVVGTVKAREGTVRARVRKAVTVLDAGLLQMGAGRPIGADATLAQPVVADGLVVSGTAVGVGKGRMVAAGGGNLIFGQDAKGNIVADPAKLVGPDGASLVGPDGASLIGNDGSTLIGLDGASLTGADIGGLPDVKHIAASTILSHNGGAVISRDGAGVIARDGASVLSHNGGTMVAAGGLNMVAAGGGNMVAAGAGN